MQFKFNHKSLIQAIAPNDQADTSGGAGDATAETTQTPAAETTQTPAAEDLTGLKSALAAERKRAAEFEKQLKQTQSVYEGVDPNVARQAQEKIKQMQAQQEEWNRKEAEISNRITEESNRRIAAASESAKQWQDKHDSLLRRTIAQQAYESAGGRTGGSDDGITFFDAFYGNIQGGLRLNDRGEIEVVDGSGARLASKKNASDFMGATEYFSNYANHPVFGHYFAATGNSRGGGMPPGSANTARAGVTRYVDRHDSAALAEPGVIEALAKGDGSVILR